ncbi:SRPBCC family protein [Actinacidiphila bryophytorum]|uniref:SRPBCC family protein n=1 Tax=Actinacidiphila bryophytorum TaxID=1436133 RepID=UPI0021769F92|nr:SRPBCC family protein [Actinacidiphila bryophytorum]UWE10458.1 SRPBCC family protein [Actinacidiphila bryophytorum]
MAKQKEKSSAPTGLDDLREEFGHFLSDVTQGWVDKASDKVSDLTDRLSDIAEGKGGEDGGKGGGLLGIGSRVLHGDSPLKAAVGQKTKDAKDAVVGKVKDAVGGGGGGGGKGGGIKAVNIVESIDVGVPLRTAYDQWTQFEDFSGFTKGVHGVSQEDDTTTTWNVKVGPSSRSWKATIQEQIPDERIVWTSEGAKGSTTGCVSFHEIGQNLTRILVVVEYSPAGFFEKTGNLWRAQGRRLRLDLKHFGRHITLHADEELEGWRGEVRDGEVVRSHEEGLEDDEAAEDTENGEDYDEDAYDEADEGAEDEDWDEEPEEGEYEDDEEEDDGEEEDKDEDEPRRSRRGRR